MIDNELKSTLTKLEQRMLEADAAYDSAFFAEHCAGDFIAVGSYGIMSRRQVMEMYESGSATPGRHSEVKDPRVQPLGDGGAAITYTMVSTTPEGTSSWYATSVYRMTPEGWRIAILQHTPA